MTVSFTIPLQPPSVNHYWKHWITPDGKHKAAVTKEGQAFKDAVAIFARGETVAPVLDKDRLKVRYAIHVKMVLGYKRRGDGDNILKVIGDSLQAAGVIHSDAYVRRWVVDVDELSRPAESYTEIAVEVMA